MARIVGVPSEIKDMEGRVFMQPDGMEEARIPATSLSCLDRSKSDGRAP